MGLVFDCESWLVAECGTDTGRLTIFVRRGCAVNFQTTIPRVSTTGIADPVTKADETSRAGALSLVWSKPAQSAIEYGPVERSIADGRLLPNPHSRRSVVHTRVSLRSRRTFSRIIAR